MLSVGNYFVFRCRDRLKYEKVKTIGDSSNRFRNSLQIYDTFVSALESIEKVLVEYLYGYPKSLIVRN
jgi:hypothetical protein